MWLQDGPCMRGMLRSLMLPQSASLPSGTQYCCAKNPGSLLFSPTLASKVTDVTVIGEVPWGLSREWVTLLVQGRLPLCYVLLDRPWAQNLGIFHLIHMDIGCQTAARGLRKANRVGACGGQAKAWRIWKVLARGKVRQ